MGMERYKEEQIIAELLFAESKTKDFVFKAIGVTPVTYTCWRQKYGSMTKSDAKKLKDLEKENNSLKRIVADQALDINVLKEFAKRNL